MKDNITYNQNIQDFIKEKLEELYYNYLIGNITIDGEEKELFSYIIDQFNSNQNNFRVFYEKFDFTKLGLQSNHPLLDKAHQGTIHDKLQDLFNFLHQTGNLIDKMKREPEKYGDRRYIKKKAIELFNIAKNNVLAPDNNEDKSDNVDIETVKEIITPDYIRGEVSSFATSCQNNMSGNIDKFIARLLNALLSNYNSYSEFAKKVSDIAQQENIILPEDFNRVNAIQNQIKNLFNLFNGNTQFFEIQDQNKKDQNKKDQLKNHIQENFRSIIAEQYPQQKTISDLVLENKIKGEKIIHNGNIIIKGDVEGNLNDDKEPLIEASGKITVEGNVKFALLRSSSHGIEVKQGATNSEFESKKMTIIRGNVTSIAAKCSGFKCYGTLRGSDIIAENFL